MPAIEHFLSEHTNPQVTFVVQRQPKTLDDAVACTLETESYRLRGAKDTQVATVALLEPSLESASLAAVPDEETLRQLLQSLSLRMEKLEKTMECVLAPTGRTTPSRPECTQGDDTTNLF